VSTATQTNEVDLRIRTPEQRQAFQEKRRREQAEKRYQEARRRRQEQMEKELSPEKIDSWMNDPRPLCPICWQPSDSIAVRIDPFLKELRGVEEEMESCLGCWDARRLEI